MKRKVDMINGKLLPNMLLFAVPIILSGVLQTLYNSADSIVVGRYESSLALGAVGSTTSIINMVVSLFTGMSLGTNVLVARYYGAGDAEKTKKAADTGIILALVSGLLAAFVGYFLAEPIAEIMKLDKDIIDMSVLYMKIFFWGVPFTSLFNFMAAALRGIGDSKNPMYCSVTAGAVNVILNIIFVKYFKMGVAGVAVATVIAQAVSAVMAFFMLKASEIKLMIRKLQFNGRMCRDTILLGFPAGLQGAVFSFSNTINISGVNSFGAAAATANSIALQVEQLLYAVINSVTQAIIPFTSQNIGAKKKERITKILFTGWGIAIVMGIVSSVIAYALKLPIIDIFAPGNADGLKSDIIKYAIIRFKLVILLYCLLGFMEIPGGVLRGMGKTMLSMIMSVVGICGFRITWQLFVFPQNHTMGVLMAGYPISWIATGVAYTVAYIIVKEKFDKQYM